VGTEGRAFSRFVLLGLPAKVGIEEGAADFFELKLGYRRIDLTRSNLLGLRIVTLDPDLGRLLILFIVADLAIPRGVCRFGRDGDLVSTLGRDGDLVRVGIELAEVPDKFGLEGDLERLAI